MRIVPVPKYKLFWYSPRTYVNNSFVLLVRTMVQVRIYYLVSAEIYHQRKKNFLLLLGIGKGGCVLSSVYIYTQTRKLGENKFGFYTSCWRKKTFAARNNKYLYKNKSLCCILYCTGGKSKCRRSCFVFVWPEGPLVLCKNRLHSGHRLLNDLK